MDWGKLVKSNGLGRKQRAGAERKKMMFTKMLEENRVFLRKLQLFSDDGGEPGGGSGPDDPADPPDGGDDSKPLSFDDFLKQKGNQAEFDKRVNKAIETAITRAKEQWELETNDKLTEAEKLARMTKEQKAEYRQKQLEKELAELKREKAMSEMAGTARKMLGDEGINIPDELLTSIIGTSAEETKNSVESFCKLFKDSVQAQVKESLKGGAPKKGSENKLTKEQILEIKDPIERQKKIADNIELFS